MNSIIETIEKEFPNYVIIFERGGFCNVYHEDSYIIGYLMNYKVKELGDGVTCGFPKNSLNKVISILENKKINYILLDRRHCYEEENKIKYKDNKYSEYYSMSYKYITMQKRLDNITKYVLDNIENELAVKLVNKCEVYINETRKTNNCKSC